jgi:hypothetical protein
VHKIEGACDNLLGDEAVHLCADAALRRILTASSAKLATYRNLIPDRSRGDEAELVPLDICRAILGEAVQRRWPDESGRSHLSVALADATNVLKRLELKGGLGLAPEDEEAIASL